ncbi:MAG: STAS domain-containing protein [Planctomycetales bacterium]
MANKKLLQITPDQQVSVLHLGDMEIWDGADMSLLRETLLRLIKVEKRRAIGIDMTYVKYIPSGFFGMLFDWYETGVQIRLYAPQPNVRKMLWFTRFFEPLSEGCHMLKPQPEIDEFPLEFPVPAAEASKPRRRVVDRELVVAAGSR